jgi:peptidoglycan-associated lipoprotein
MKHLLPLLLLTAACGGHRLRPPVAVLPVGPTHHDDAKDQPLAEPLNAEDPAPEARSPEPRSIRDPTIARPNLDDAITVINRELRDAFFDYDRSDPPAEAVQALREDAALIVQALRDFPQLAITVEGHCDERGSAEYNLALGDRRAQRASSLLREFAVPAANLKPVSYGKEAPQCLESTENCWRKNRRAHLVVRPPS